MIIYIAAIIWYNPCPQHFPYIIAIIKEYNRLIHVLHIAIYIYKSQVLKHLQPPGCYRRCGIAGLAAGQHVGRHSKGANPFYPLVLPTVPTVCYGHCYPLHKVFQYFYAGTEAWQKKAERWTKTWKFGRVALNPDLIIMLPIYWDCHKWKSIFGLISLYKDDFIGK